MLLFFSGKVLLVSNGLKISRHTIAATLYNIWVQPQYVLLDKQEINYYY